MSKVIRELSDEEVWRLGLDDFPYVEEEFENIKNDDNVIGMAIPKDDNKIIKFPISTAEENIQDKKCDYKLLREIVSRFGQNIDAKKLYQDRYLISTQDVPISQGLIGWIMMMQNQLKVLSPHYLQLEIKERIEKMSKQYEDVV